MGGDQHRDGMTTSFTDDKSSKTRIDSDEQEGWWDEKVLRTKSLYQAKEKYYSKKLNNLNITLLLDFRKYWKYFSSKYLNLEKWLIK